ncbi:hypothetical protein K1719_007424 [Acacia pycnantha]|nr:hypothetical protein K1719_007424 [Acacia pycnantha]
MEVQRILPVQEDTDDTNGGNGGRGVRLDPTDGSSIMDTSGAGNQTGPIKLSFKNLSPIHNGEAELIPLAQVQRMKMEFSGAVTICFLPLVEDKCM